MTTVVMAQVNGDVVVGWDSMMTTGSYGETMATPKVFANGNILIGIAGTLAAFDVFETATLPQYEGQPNKRHWLIREFVPAIRLLMAGHNEISDEEGDPEFSMLVVVDGEVFRLDGNLAVFSTLEGTYAVGSGAHFAQGALTARKIQLCAASPRGEMVLTREDVLLALEVAEHSDAFTQGPLFVGEASRILAAKQPAAVPA